MALGTLNVLRCYNRGTISAHIWNDIKSLNSQLTDIEEQLETDSIPIKEEEEEDIPEDTDESERSSEKEEKPTMPFGDFLDLMEVFWAQTCSVIAEVFKTHCHL